VYSKLDELQEDLQNSDEETKRKVDMLEQKMKTKGKESHGPI
jgi:hypothetical protein